MPDQPLDFFVSYTGRDEVWAAWVAWRLELAGYRVVLQAWDFGAGSFLVQMEEAIRRAERLLAIVSESYLESRWGRMEWAAYMKASQSSVIPVQIEDLNTRSLLGSLRRINLVALKEAEAECKLLEEIEELVGQPRHGPLEREVGRFPGIAYRVSVDAPSAGAPAELPRSTVPVDRDRIQLVLLGAGAARREAVVSFRRLLDVRPDRCCDLFDSELSPAEQLDELAKLLRDLDPDEVSDVLIVFAGEGSSDPDVGVRLHVRATDPRRPVTTSVISLAELLERLQDDQHRLRGYVILDAVDAAGRSVGPTNPVPVPVLKLGGDAGGGLARIQEALVQPAQDLLRRLGHWGPLSLEDLRVLVDGELVAREHSPAHEIGLVPNPLAWPRHRGASAALANWCSVISTTDRHHEDERVELIVDKLAAHSRGLLNGGYHRAGRQVELAPKPGMLRADEVLSSPASFAHAVEHVCGAELVIFDLTNYEPAVMILLGIRAVIRRGLTVCVAGEHAPPWQAREPPFHLREVSLVRPPDREAVESRILEGVKQLAQPGSYYSDLPCFDLIRAVPPDPDQRQTHAFDAERNPSILALVPFDPKYVQRNWKEIKDSLPAAARDEIITRRGGAQEVKPPRLLRTLDLDSPRVVSAQLFEAIRLTDFCLVDLTSARPNVLFELGVRLAANHLHPVVVVDPDYLAGDEESAWLKSMRDQLEMLRRLLQPVEYSPKDPDAFSRMVARHLELRRLLQEPEDPRADTLLGGLPPTGVYDLGWPHAVVQDETVTIPVETHLQSGGEALLVDQTSGQRHLIYPTRHRLADDAERTGREYLVAAWLYLHFRARAGDSADEDLGDRYQTLTAKLIDLLEETGDQSDASFVTRIEDWMADGPEADEGSGGDRG